MGGIAFTNAENPTFRLLTNTHLHADTLSRNVRRLGEMIEGEMMLIVRDLKIGAATIDEWTSGAMQSFLSVCVCGVTEKYDFVQVCLKHLPITGGTAAILSGAVLQVLLRFGIAEKVTRVVSDNAAAPIAAVRLMGKARSPCYAHVLNLVFQDVVEGLLGRLRPLLAMATRIRHSAHFHGICDGLRKDGVLATGRNTVRAWSPTRWYAFTLSSRT